MYTHKSTIIKDGFLLSKIFSELINRVSRKIVLKSEISHFIAEKLSKLKVKFNKNNETRWNSIIFMIDSVLKLRQNQIKEIQYKMPDNTRQHIKLRLIRNTWVFKLHQRQSRECSLFLDTFSALKEED